MMRRLFLLGLLAVPCFGQHPSDCVPFSLAAVDFIGHSSITLLPLVTVPDGWAPILIRLNESVLFESTSPRVTSLTASIGTLRSPDFYLREMPLMAGVSVNAIGGSPAQAKSHTIYAAVRVTNADPGDLSRLDWGLLEGEICGAVVPVAVVLPPPPPPKPPPPSPPPPPPPPPPHPVTCTTLGTLVRGACLSRGTGFHVVGPASVVNETEANCCLP